ncbi:MAG: hypothetical protein U0T83_05415 [Bacteriovoracaceae bacterium]
MKKFIYALLMALLLPTQFTYADEPLCQTEQRNEALEVLGVQIEAVSKMTALINSEEEGGPEMSAYFELMVNSIKKIYEVCPNFKTQIIDVNITYRLTPDSVEWKEELKQDESLRLIDFVKVMNTKKDSFAYELLDSIK